MLFAPHAFTGLYACTFHSTLVQARPAQLDGPAPLVLQPGRSHAWDRMPHVPPQLQEGRLCLFARGTLLTRVGAASAGTVAAGLPRRGLYQGPHPLGNHGGGGPPVLPCFTRIHPLLTLASTDYAMFFHVASILPPPLHEGVLVVHLHLTPSVGLRPVAGFKPLPEVCIAPSPSQPCLNCPPSTCSALSEGLESRSKRNSRAGLFL